jgi:hypothetical protein
MREQGMAPAKCESMPLSSGKRELSHPDLKRIRDPGHAVLRAASQWSKFG